MNPFPIDELKARKEYLEQYSFSSDEDFASKLKSYYSDNQIYRRTGRTYLMIRILIEISIESHKEVNIADHFDIFESSRRLAISSNIIIDDVLDWYHSHGIIIKKRQLSLERVRFELIDGHSFYNYFRIGTINPFIKKKEFSKKLLLII